MSKHLRFRSLLGALAIMLTLSMAWSSVSAQNTSSDKDVLAYSVAGQVSSDIDTDAKTVDIVVPYGTATTLATTFQVSPFAQLYRDQQAGGAFDATDLLASGDDVDYTDVVAGDGTIYLTVEAENHSFWYYLVTIDEQLPSADADLMTVQLDYDKWQVLCDPHLFPDPTAPTAFTADDNGWTGGTTINFTTLAYPNYDEVTLYFTLSSGATAQLVNATASTTTTLTGDPSVDGALDFDTDGDGDADVISLVVTAQNGTTTSTYVFTFDQELPVVNDDLLTFDFVAGSHQPAGFTEADVTINRATNVIDVVVNYWPTAAADLASLVPTYTMDTYATGKSSDVWTGAAISAQTDEICSGTDAIGTGMVLNVFAEDRTEISTWTINITVATARTGNSLESIRGTYTATWGCGVSDTFGPINGVVGSSTVTFNVANGVSEVSLYSVTSPDVNPVLSAGATVAYSASPLVDGSTITVTSEAGVDKVYTVALVEGAGSSAAQLLTFGFHSAIGDNLAAGVTADVAGTITGGLVEVIVPWNTDLYTLTPYFTASDYSSVYIIESNMTTYTEQCSDVTENDFSNSQTYVVRAQDGTEERWDVTVKKAAVLTGNELIDFSIVGMPMCIGPDADVAGVYDGTDITVTVKYGTDVTDLETYFTISEGATASVASGDALDFTTPQTITVTAQNGAVATYTITVVVRNTDDKSVKKINKYWFAKEDNSGFGADVPGEINETAKTIHLWVPWGTDVTSLVATFELENPVYTRMTRSEDLITNPELMQYSGVSENDYTTPIAYTVYAEDCSTVEYFVTVFITPNTNTDISAFTFDMYGCACEKLVDGELVSTLVNEIDIFAKRIHITIPHEMESALTSLAPYMITIHPEATIEPAATEAQDWTKGPVSYVVTAPDGVTKTTWTVLVEAPACQETDILSFSLPEIQVSSSDLNSDYHENVVTFDYTNHTIDVIIKQGAKLDKVYYERTLSCGAEICCVSGNCVDNHYLDFSESLCHTCVVTAQDESITQEWTICLIEIDTECPTVATESVLAMNCADSVMVTSSEPGEVFIIHEDALACIESYYPCNCDPSNPLGDTDRIDDFIDEKVLSKSAVSVDTLGNVLATSISTEGLYSGVYYAFSIDTWGNVSCQSKQKLFIDICEKEVATVADLKAADPVFLYTLTGEVLVTYEEERTSGNLKYVQDATAGLEIRDLNSGCTEEYGLGAGLTNLKGMIVDVNKLSGNNPCEEEDGCSLVFVPICCYSPELSSEGNVVAPIELTFSEWAAAPRAYDAMFIRITNPLMFNSDGTFWFGEDRIDVDALMHDASGNSEWLFGHSLNTNYIGESFPDEPKIYQGINTYNVYSGDDVCYGTLTPRWVAVEEGDDSDILEVGECLLYGDPTPVTISGVIPGTCSSLTDVDIVNDGANSVTITALYLDDLSGQDEFELIYPTPVPFALDHWGNDNGANWWETVQVQFCPKDAGDEEATLVVEYCDGTILEVPILGSTILVVDAPYFTNFNKATEGSTDGWVSTNMIYGDNRYSFGVDGQIFYYGWSWVTPNSARPVILESPGIMIEDLQNPVVKWWMGTYFSSNLRVDVSTDYKATWTTVKDFGNFTFGNAVGQWNEVDLKAFEGETEPIFIRWYSTGANYYGIDNVSIDQKVTSPIYSGSADAISMGGVQLGSSSTVTYTVANVGASVLKVKSVELINSMKSTAYTLTDENAYPFEIHDGNYAYTVDPSGDALSVDVTFAPEDVGTYEATLRITWGLYEDKVVEVPITGDGLSCNTAAEAVLGENLAPSQNSWFTFTAPSFMMAYVHSCHPNQDVSESEAYAYDTYLQIYADCDGTLIAENDDLEWDACPYNRASSGLLLPLNEGETIKIFWDGRFMADTEHGYDPFYFQIDATYPIDGDVCETAIPLTLPVVNHFGTTVGFEDDYDMSPCSPYSNYMDGNDKVYTITLESDGYLTGNILGAYGSIHVLDKCPKEELEKQNCKAFVGGPNGGEFTKRIAAGTYYVIISTWAPPQTVDYLLNMSFEEGSGIDENGLGSSLTVYPNPTNGEFTVSITSAEAKDLTVELVNISGQVVYRNEVKAVYNYNENIDASEFAKGVYYLKVNDGSEVKVEKVVVQ